MKYTLHYLYNKRKKVLNVVTRKVVYIGIVTFNTELKFVGPVITTYRTGTKQGKNTSQKGKNPRPFGSDPGSSDQRIDVLR